MKFIIILICMAIERFYDVQPVMKRFSWFSCYPATVYKVLGKLPTLPKLAQLAVLLGALPLIVWLVVCVFGGLLAGLIGSLLSILVLLYCLGPDDLYQQMADYREAREADQGDRATQIAEKFLRGVIPEAMKDIDRDMVSALFHEFNTRVAAVIFWFAVLGPFGAVLYRTSTLLLKNAEQTDHALHIHHAECEKFLSLLDWIPGRLLGLLYGICGQFSESFGKWCQHVLAGLQNTSTLLTECGMAALTARAQPEDEVASLKQLQEASTLVERSVYAVVIVSLLLIL